MRFARLAAAAAIVLFIAAFAGIGRPDGAGAAAPPVANRGITVSGTGKVTTVPDEAQISVGVETRAATAKEALDQNAAQTQRLIDALKRAGADEKEIQTQQVSLYPNVLEGGTVSGYVATNSVSAKEDVDEVGDLIEAASAAGANQISGPMLSRSDSEELYREALKKAVDDARRNARALADAAGVKLGGVVRIVEGGAGEPIPYALSERAVAADAAGAAKAPIEPGQQEIQASVSVTFDLS
jgi:uncharacterized protein YggE